MCVCVWWGGGGGGGTIHTPSVLKVVLCVCPCVEKVQRSYRRALNPLLMLSIG